VRCGGDTGARPGADIDRRSSDGTGGRHPAEQWRRQIGEALTEQFAVGIVTAAVGHAVGKNVEVLCFRAQHFFGEQQLRVVKDTPKETVHKSQGDPVAKPVAD
jgi:hypothetical protein